MNDPKKTELLSHILDGYASDEEKARLLDRLEESQSEREEAAEQIVINSLLGVSLEGDRGLDFQARLKLRLEEEENRNLFRRVAVTMRRNTRRLAFVGGPLLAALAWFGTHHMLRGGMPGGGDPSHACWVASVMVLCAIWWLLEPIPMGAVSLIPLAVFPLAGVLDEQQIAEAYGNHLVILFLSGFMLSRAMEHSGAHRRVALGMVRVIGSAGGKRLVLGFMVASAGISMWVSNTVTVLMILPAALAVIDQSRSRRLSTPLLLGISYAAALGGMATPAGTPPNGIFMAQADRLVEQGVLAESFSFIDWMKAGVPVMLITVPLAWLWLTRGPWPKSPVKIAPVGPWTKPEVRVSIVLGVTALLWVTRRDPFGGWISLLDLPVVKDSTVGLLAVIALFLIPSGEAGDRKLLDWEHATKVPWSILILLGGGIAIGSAFSASGLSHAMASNLQLLADLPTLPMVGIVAVGVSMLTVSSNTATATVMMPLLAAMAVAADLPPVLLMLSASMANSCSFMLPVSTPPNAIVFAVGEFTIRRMFWEGLVVKLMSLIVIVGVCYLIFG